MQKQAENCPIKIKEPIWCDKCGFSKTGETCENCIKIEQERVRAEVDKKNALIANLGGLRSYQNYTAERFLDKKLLNSLSEYPNINIFITGSVGSGKTHLGTALIRNCEKFYRLSSIELLRRFRTFIGKQNSAILEENFLHDLINYPLMIDDLGSEKTTENSSQIIYEIIDRRYELGNGGLIITTNFDLTASRVSSRLVEMCKVIKLEGNDRRLK